MRERRLAAIMSVLQNFCESGFTDITDYTALMGLNGDLFKIF